MKNIRFLLVGVLSLSFCAPVRAGLFGDKAQASPPQGQTKMVRKYLLQVPDKKTEKELLDLMRSKKWLTEDLMVLDRILGQRKAKHDALQGSLGQQYAIERDLKYDYDPASKSIYAMALPAGGVTTDKSERVLYKQLKTDQEGQRFQSLYRACEDTSVELRVLQVVARERQQELGRVDGLLKSKFSMKMGRFYNYDDKAMILYEMIPVSSKAVPEADQPVAK